MQEPEGKTPSEKKDTRHLTPSEKVAEELAAMTRAEKRHTRVTHEDGSVHSLYRGATRKGPGHAKPASKRWTGTFHLPHIEDDPQDRVGRPVYTQALKRLVRVGRISAFIETLTRDGQELDVYEAAVNCSPNATLLTSKE
jgi:hypothetical protein